MKRVSCGRCGGINNTKEVCPECGLAPNRQKSRMVTNVSLDEIPNYYKGKVWSSKQFWRYHTDKVDNYLYKDLITQMEKVHNSFREGKLPTRSGIFTSPPGTSKLTWCYSCLQLALHYGMSVAPIMDTAELKRMLVMSTERSYNYSGLTLDDFLRKDVVFISVTKTEQRRGSASVIVDLLDKRARLGKPTFFVSRYSIHELSYWDKSNDFLQIKSNEDSGDPLKVPSIITVI